MLASGVSFLLCLAVALLGLATTLEAESDVSKLQHSDAYPTTTPDHVVQVPPTTSSSEYQPTKMIYTQHGVRLDTTRFTAPPLDTSHPLNARSSTGFRIFGYILAGGFVGTIIGLVVRIYFRQSVEGLCLALRDRFSPRLAMERRRWYGR